MYEKTISDPKKFEMIKARERAIRDYAGRMAYERKQGIVEGIEQGKFEIARNLLKEEGFKPLLSQRPPVFLLSK